MDEKTLVKVALIGALSGILMLLFITEKMGVDDATIALLAEEDIEKVVKIKGTLTSVRETPSVTLLTLEDKSGKIKVVVFREATENNLQEKDLVEVEGIVKEYKNSLELEAKTIKIFN